MAKLPPKKEEGNTQEWLNTYADMVTLLLTFFVMLFACSNLDETKIQYFVQAFQMRGKVINTVVDKPNDNDADSDGGNADQPNPGGGEGEMPQSYEELYQYFSEYIESNNLSDNVSVSENEAYFILTFNSQVFFDGDSYVLKPEGRKMISDICPAIRAMNDHIRTLTVSGHTAVGASALSDWSLSTQRAASVVNYMDPSIGGEAYSVGYEVLPQSKYIAEGYGNTRPIASNDTPEGRQKNRRVEMRMLKEDFDDTDPKVLQDLLNHDYHLGATPFDPNAKPNTDYENLPEGSIDKIIGFINDKYSGGLTQSGIMGPGAVDGSQFIASAESGGGTDSGAEDNGGDGQSE